MYWNPHPESEVRLIFECAFVQKAECLVSIQIPELSLSLGTETTHELGFRREKTYRRGIDIHRLSKQPVELFCDTESNFARFAKKWFQKAPITVIFLKYSQ